ncbi:MAG: TetR/AcrR family transcriptional regulator [Novosphingobium sp.]
MDGGNVEAGNRARDARQLKSDAALRTSLLALITRQSYDKITVRDIVAEAGIGYATFFRHYPSKDALLDAVAGEEIAAMMRLTAPLLSPTDTRATCVALAEYVGGRRAVWTALLTGGAAGHLREQFVRLAPLADVRDVGNTWLPPDLGVIFGVTSTVEILTWWLRQAPDYPARKVAELLDRLVITPTVGAVERNQT